MVTNDKDKKRWRQEAWWLTAWASWLSVSCTSVGLCFDFLGLEVRPVWPLWPPCESTLLAVSSPTLPELLPLLDGMFSLLVSALIDAALFSDRKRWGNERSAFNLTLSVAYFGLSFSAPYWMECYRKLNAKVVLIPHLLIASPAGNVLFSFSANSIYCLFTVHALIDIFCYLWSNALL